MTTEGWSSRKISLILAVVFILGAAWLAPGTVLVFALHRWVIAAALSIIIIVCLVLAVRFARPRRTGKGG